MNSIDLKKRVVEYRLNNHTLKETSETFQIGTTIIKKWIKEFQKTGTFKEKYDSSNRTFKKIDPTKLSKYIEKYNDAFLYEIADSFSCSKNSIQKALRKLKLTQKKRPICTKREIKKNELNI